MDVNTKFRNALGEFLVESRVEHVLLGGVGPDEHSNAVVDQLTWALAAEVLIKHKLQPSGGSGLQLLKNAFDNEIDKCVRKLTGKDN